MCVCVCVCVCVAGAQHWIWGWDKGIGGSLEGWSHFRRRSGVSVRNEESTGWALLLEGAGEDSEKSSLFEGSFRGSQDYNDLTTRLELRNQ